MSGMSRRFFVKAASAGLAAGAVALKAPAQMMGGGGGGGTGTIDPPAGAPFADPVEMPNISNVGGVVEVNLEAKRALVNVNGVNANLLTYNGFFPAPTIRAKAGDRLRIHFKNSLPDLGTNILGFSRDMTNLHTHGLHVSPSGNSDNAMRDGERAGQPRSEHQARPGAAVADPQRLQRALPQAQLRRPFDEHRRIVAPIGAGGMGEVYRARDTRLDRTVAIKILPAEFAQNAQLKLRFAREAKAISALSHPHICTLFDVGSENGLDFLVMEYLEGESLADRLARGPLPIEEVLNLGAVDSTTRRSRSRSS